MKILKLRTDFKNTQIFEKPYTSLYDSLARVARPVWKARSGLPISDNWTFFARCYFWGVTSENRSKIGNFAPTRSLWPQISGRRGRSPPIFFAWTVRANEWLSARLCTRKLKKYRYNLVKIYICYDILYILGDIWRQVLTLKEKRPLD